MRLMQLMLRAVIVLAVGAVPAIGLAQHAHDHGSEAGELTLDHGRKWQTDEPLRLGMDTIRRELASGLPAIRRGQWSAKEYERLADRIDAQIEFIVKNCRLAPEADAQLHIVLGHVARGVSAMREGHDRAAGATQVAQALDAYAEHFEHPGWRRLMH